MKERPIKEIVTDWLKQHDCEGLAHNDCACELDDLMPCGEPNLNYCVAAKVGTAPPEYEDDLWMVPKQFPDDEGEEGEEE